jgi:Bromodomain
MTRVKGRLECKTWFSKPVDPNIPNYLNIIKNPIDFGTISKNLHTKKYKSPVSTAQRCCVFAVSLLAQQQQSLVLLLLMLSYCFTTPMPAVRNRAAL